ncbi:MAG: ATP-grasp domain-containing protein [Woeseiaceae bacterium]|nr:ATP-grasp domain-containing protein [Woeseiaceae bacterium]
MRLTAETKTVLLTLGRLPVGLDIARSFAALGWRVLVADPFSMHLAKMSRAVSNSLRVRAPVDDPAGYLEDLERIVSDHRIDLVVPVSEETMYVAALDSAPDRFCRPQSETLALHDKFRFIETAHGFSLPVPATGLADDPESADITQSGAFIAKPRFSCGGRGVSFHEAGDAVAGDSDWLIQEQLQGDHVSVFCIARGGSTLASSAYRGTVVDGSVSVAFERIDCETAESWARSFVEQSGHTGFIAFDFFVGDDGVARAIECNPRATSGIHFIDEQSIAPAILGTATEASAMRTERHRVESYSCFTKLQGSVFRPREFRRILRELRRSSDVTWARSDPWPFLLMMINTWPIIWRALTRRKTFAVASMLDIEWRPPGQV